MTKNRLISILLSILISNIIFAQNKIWLTNGKVLNAVEYKLDNKELVIYRNAKGKFKSIERFDVFAIIENSNKEIIIYEPDSTSTESFSLLEMRAFVEGQSDAQKNFKSPLTTIGGVVVAGVGASSLVLNPIYSIIISGVYCGAIGVTKSGKNKIIIPENYYNNEFYLTGYKKTTKQKRIKNAIIGSLVGLAAGFGTYAIINN